MLQSFRFSAIALRSRSVGGCFEGSTSFCKACLPLVQHANTITTTASESAKEESTTETVKKRYKKPKMLASKKTVQKSDIFGPPDPVSNMQTIHFYIPPDETPMEKKFRLQRADVLAWNHKFWANHNSKFFKEKGEFTKKLSPPGKDGGKKLSPAEQMSVFYRKFLNENREEHLHYNKEWYKKNISLLWPAFLVFCIRLRRRLFPEVKS